MAERTGPTLIASAAGAAPAWYVPCSVQEGAAGWTPALRLFPARGMEFADPAWFGPHEGQSGSRFSELALHAETTLAANVGVEGRLGSPDPRWHRFRAPRWERPPLLLPRLPTVPKAEVEAARFPGVLNREDRIPQARRSHGANALPKAISLEQKPEQLFLGSRDPARSWAPGVCMSERDALGESD